MRLAAITRHATGPRLWVLGQRIHHGATGCVLAATGAAVRKPVVVALGAALALHDRGDVRVWFVREALEGLAAVRALGESLAAAADNIDSTVEAAAESAGWRLDKAALDAAWAEAVESRRGPDGLFESRTYK